MSSDKPIPTAFDSTQITEIPDFTLYPPAELKEAIKQYREFAFHSEDEDLRVWFRMTLNAAEAEIGRRKALVGTNGNGNGQHTEQVEFWPEAATMKEFFADQGEERLWAWDQVVPFGEVAMVCGEPRAGKTTLALNLALAISRGVPFLSRPTTKAKCLYVAIDNSKWDMRGVAKQLKMGDYEDVLMYVGPIPARATEWVLDNAAKNDVKFIVIDTMERFYPKFDINKPEFAKAMVPLDEEAKRLGITIVYVHHATAKPSDASKIGALFMGHTTVKGMTPYYMELYRVGKCRHRILSTDLRSGENIDAMYVKVDQKSGWCTKGGKLEDALMDEYVDKIVDWVAQNPIVSRKQICAAIGGQDRMANLALAKCEKTGKLEWYKPDINVGKSGRPRLYVVAGTLVPDPEPDSEGSLL